VEEEEGKRERFPKFSRLHFPFDSASDGTLADGCLFLKKVVKTQEKCPYGFVGVRENAGCIEIEGAVAADQEVVGQSV